MQPDVIVTLGNVALRALLGDKAAIGACHGRMAQAFVSHEGEERAFDVFPLYHPASIIYNRSLKEVYQGDLHLLKALLDTRADKGSGVV